MPGGDRRVEVSTSPLGIGCADAAAFDLDVLACPRCGGRLRLIATVEDPEAIRAILAAASREEAGRAPPGAAAQPPSPTAELGA